MTGASDGAKLCGDQRAAAAVAERGRAVKLHGIMVAKNEADVIGDALRAAARRFDHIYVYDNGSTDGTWALVRALAEEHPAIEPVESSDRPFSNLIREEVLAAYRGRGARGDWWCKLDADEIYAEDPWVFLSRVPPGYQLVHGASFQFYFTDRDLERHEADPGLYGADVPIEDRLRHYVNNWSEARFVRDDGGRLFRDGHPWGRVVFPQRIWLRHYKYRSPGQIARRLADRLAAARAGPAFKHEIGPELRRGAPGAAEPHWRERVARAAELDYDAGDGRLVLREDRMPPLPPPPLGHELRALRGRIGAHLRARRRPRRPGGPER